MLELLTWLVVMMLAEPQSARQEEFSRSVQPILERRCQPCHFLGGVMHEKLPFDKAATVDELGTKLFSRIKKEDEREVIRKFLASSAD